MNIIRDQSKYAEVKRDESVHKQKEFEGKSDSERLDENVSVTQYDDSKIVRLSTTPNTTKLSVTSEKPEFLAEQCYLY